MTRAREFSELATVYDSGASIGFRNRIINGDMRIDQRNAGASVNNINNTLYSLDRWGTYGTQASKFSVQRNAGSVTPPAGFTNYLGVTSSSAYSVLSTDIFQFYQIVEGFNCADLAWGTSNAQPITLSFWVRSSLTGTHSGVLQNSAQNRAYGFTFTINAANTWEQKTITVAGDTSGTWLTDNNSGLRLEFNLGTGSSLTAAGGAWSGSTFFAVTGSVSVVGTNGATFYITGVQLEAGTVASPFERRDYGRELMMCQRYFQQVISGATTIVTGHCRSNTNADFQVPAKVSMRSGPTLLPTTGTCSLQVGGSNYSVTSFNAQDPSTADVLTFRANVSSGLTAGYAAVLSVSSGSSLVYSAEL